MKTPEQIDDAIDRVIRTDISDFLKLVEISGLNPSKDFRFTNLSGVDFSDCDLSGFDFTGASIEGATFSRSRISSAIFDDVVGDLTCLQDASDWAVYRQRNVPREVDEIDRQVSDMNKIPARERIAVAGGSASDRLLSRIFISYARRDGATFAADLHKKLVERRLSVWQDIASLEGGRDWWSQIEEAIRSKALEHFVLVVTPAALDSAVMRQEIRLARQEGKTVSPIRGPGLGDLNKLPRWLGQLYDLDLPEHRNRLFGVLALPSRQKRVPMMAPEPLADFVKRPVEFDALKQKLLDPKGDALAISAALKGAGGYGKTTLAKALAHDADIQDAYFDGVLWTELGERPDNLLGIISDLITRLTGTQPGLVTVNAAASALAEALGDRRILLIIDDAWREQDLKPFLQGGPHVTRLITTRIDNILPAGTKRQLVDAMNDKEALKLLAWELPADQTSAQNFELGKLAARLGEWPLLIKLVNGFLCDRVLRIGQSLSHALVGVNKRLDKGLAAFDARNPSDRSKTVTLTVGASLDLLDAEQRARFGELGIFPEDTDVPFSVVSQLWAETGNLDECETEDLLVKLYSLSLLLSVDLDHRTFRLHHILRRFLREQAGAEELVTQNKRLLRAIDNGGKSRATDALEQRYFYLHLANHLVAANERDRLDRLLLDPGWSKAKFAATSEHRDSQRDRGNRMPSISPQTPNSSISQLTRPNRSNANRSLDMARPHLSCPAIVTERSSLSPPGAETARLEGHLLRVIGVCALPNGRFASASVDRMIRLWDLATARLEGHWRGANALLPVGWFALSSAADHTIRVWDVTISVETARLKGHSFGVRALCALSDERRASGSDDQTIRLWDLTTGAAISRLEGYSEGVRVPALPDGRLASGSDNQTIRLWDLTTGAEISRLEGHSDGVRALALPGGRLASSSDDQTIRLWDLTTGAEISRFEGHSDGVRALCALPNGRPASGADDQTIRLWELTTDADLSRLKIDASVRRLITSSAARFVVRDALGRLHWLVVIA
jgi:hypothetical protein